MVSRWMVKAEAIQEEDGDRGGRSNSLEDSQFASFGVMLKQEFVHFVAVAVLKAFSLLITLPGARHLLPRTLLSCASIVVVK